MNEAQDPDLIWNPENPPVSEQKFQQALNEAKQANLVDAQIQFLAYLTRAQSAQKKWTEAHASLDAASQLMEQSACTDAARIRWLIEQGRLHILEKTPSQARRPFVEAWTLAVKAPEHAMAVEIAQLMASIEPQKLQAEWIKRAIQIAENSESPKTRRLLGSLYTSTAWKRFEVRQYDQALELLEKALEQFRSHGTPREIFLARWGVGRVLRAQDKFEEALAVQKGLLSEIKIGGPADGRLYEELAECLQALNRPEEAQRYFELAYKELSSNQWVTDNQPVKLKRMKDMGKVKNEPKRAQQERES